MVLVKASARQHVPMVVKESAKVVKAVVRMDAKQHVEMVVDKAAKDVAMRYVKVIV